MTVGHITRASYPKKINVLLALPLHNFLPRERMSCQTADNGLHCPENVYFERLQLSKVAVSLESLLLEFLDRSSTRSYSSSISPMDGVRLPSCCLLESMSTVPDS